MRRTPGYGGLLLLVAAVLQPLHAQAPAPGPNRVHLELGGAGLIYSVNYERLLTDRLSARAGAGGLWASGARYALALFGADWEVSTGPHALRLGLGGGVVHLADVFFLEGGEETDVYGFASLGYRFRPRPTGIFFQAAFTPVATRHEASPWGGVGIGVAF